MNRIIKLCVISITCLLIKPSCGTDLFDNLQVSEPIAGPMMGQPDVGSRRIWLKGPSVQKLDDTYYHGFVQIKKQAEDWDPIHLHTFAMNVPYDSGNVKDVKDLVGMVDLNLLPGKYTYRCGYGSSHKQELSLLTRLQWHNITYDFEIKNPRLTDSVLAFGSCRYFAQVLGINLWLSSSDKIFEAMNTRKHTFDGFAVIGDYIYADPFANILFGLFQSRKYSTFKGLYETAMNTPHFKELIATVPCFNTLDDHEVTNNFGEDYPRTHPDIYQAGMAAYMTHQHMVTPGFRNTVELNHLGYTLMIGNVHGYMMNTRSHRSSNPPQIIHEEEMYGVKRWLMNHKEDPFKVLFSSVPMFPIYANNPGQDEDKWYGYKDQMMELLNHINDNRIHGVVLCAGDVHWSMYTQIESMQGVRITTVIASPFFSPWGHDEGPFSAIQPEKGIMNFLPNFEYKHTSQVYHTDSYGELTFGKNNLLTVRLMDADGNWLNEHDKAPGTIDLTPPSEFQYRWG